MGHVVAERSVPSDTYVNKIAFILALNRITLRVYDVTFWWVKVEDDRRQIKICVTSDAYIFRPNANLSYVLGFDSTECDYGKGDHVANTFMNVPPLGNIRNMFIYCNVVEHVIVGNVTAPLLRIGQILMPDQRSGIMHTKVNTPLFVPVQKNPSIP